MHTILRLPKVSASTGLAKSTIYKKIAANEFPKPIPITAKAVGWLESDIQKWIEQQIAKSANDNNTSKPNEKNEW